MPFIPHTEDEVTQMLSTIGVASIADLFAEIPASLKNVSLDDVPPGLTELELSRLMKARAELDRGLLCFIGAGAYEHHIPAAVWEVASRGEYLTSYTPYQAEASQGTLQLLYEYQTMMASLMALPISNASMYDGASALAEAILMAVRLSRQTLPAKILLPMTIHPMYRAVVKTIVSQQDIELVEIPFDHASGCVDLKSLQEFTGENFTALVVPQPNFFGCVEEVDGLTDWAHAQNSLVIGVVNPLAMALLKPPGEWGAKGADIACGEGQPLGVPLASGGPYYGFLCCKKEYVRQLPGRIVGRTVDSNNRQGFVLTLQAREQHIRRAKATSNICTNQGLLVTASTIYMSLVGPHGLRQVALISHQNMQVLQQKLLAIQGVNKLFSQANFHECVITVPVSVDQLLQQLARQKIQGGFSLKKFYPELGEALLICTTETKTPEDLDCLVDSIQKTLQIILANETCHTI